MRRLSLLLFAALSLAGCGAGLQPFGAELGIEVAKGGKVARQPYPFVASHYGYVEKDESDEVRDGHPFHYVYFWLPEPSTEIGVRVISPFSGVKEPVSGDTVSPRWAKLHGPQTFTGTFGEIEHQKKVVRVKKLLYFNTWANLQRAVGIESRDQIEKRAGVRWVELGFNDDVRDAQVLPADNKRFSSVLRVTASPEQKLPAGLYRVGVTSYKDALVRGTFLIQVGLPSAAPGLRLERKRSALLPK